MRIEDNFKINKLANAKKKPSLSGTSNADFDSLISADSSEAELENVVAATVPVMNMTSLLSIQQGYSNNSKKMERVNHGKNILDALSKLNKDLISNNISAENATKLLKLIRSEASGNSMDPKLESIISEIELRAEVELAKLQFKKS